MNKNNFKSNTRRPIVTGKEDANSGSGAFNQGTEQDPSFNDGTKVSAEEKRTGHATSPGKETKHSKEKRINKGNSGEK